MKTKNIIVIVCCMLAATFLLGAAGVIKVTNESAQENKGPDRLIGVLITKEYLDLFDSSRYMNENINKLMKGGELNEAETAKYQGRLYAKLIDTNQNSDESSVSSPNKEYVFEGIDGIRFFAPYINDELGSYYSTIIDEGISDSSTHITSTDDGDSVSLKATIYIVSGGNVGNLYINPVYQSAKGEVYAISGEGIFFGNDNAPGFSWSQKISETQTETFGETKTSSGSEVEITVCDMPEPTNISLLQFDSNNLLLEKAEYRPGNLPEHMDTLPDTQYIIVETLSSAGLARKLFQPEDEYIYTFSCRDDGFCIKQGCEIFWSK